MHIGVGKYLCAIQAVIRGELLLLFLLEESFVNLLDTFCQYTLDSFLCAGHTQTISWLAELLLLLVFILFFIINKISFVFLQELYIIQVQLFFFSQFPMSR